MYLLFISSAFEFLSVSNETTFIHWNTRVQSPLLPTEESLIIAEELGIKHPTHPQTKEPIIITDFVVTKLEQGQPVNLARTLKYKDELIDKRVIEKFEI